MTSQPGETTPSDFNARADSAALALRQRLQGEGKQVPDSAPVEVGPDGKPLEPLPPEGSYARQAIELQKRAQEGRQTPQAPPAEGQPPSPPPQDPGAQAGSSRAEQRIKELVAKLRHTEQELQQAVENGKKATETANQFSQRLQSLETQHHEMLKANLENLDPETRMQVLQDARMSEMFDKFENRIMGKIQPQLQQIETQASRTEMQSLSDTYPAFDPSVHGPLIDMFRENNPRCTIDQAFRAIAEPDELATRSAASAQAVPPIVPPGSGELAAARFAPSNARQQQEPEPEDQLVEESRRIAKLRRSTDPEERKEGMQLLDQHLKRRLGG